MKSELGRDIKYVSARGTKVLISRFGSLTISAEAVQCLNSVIDELCGRIVLRALDHPPDSTGKLSADGVMDAVRRTIQPRLLGPASEHGSWLENSERERVGGAGAESRVAWLKHFYADMQDVGAGDDGKQQQQQQGADSNSSQRRKFLVPYSRVYENLTDHLASLSTVSTAGEQSTVRTLPRPAAPSGNATAHPSAEVHLHHVVFLTGLFEYLTETCLLAAATDAHKNGRRTVKMADIIGTLVLDQVLVETFKQTRLFARLEARNLLATFKPSEPAVEKKQVSSSPTIVDVKPSVTPHESASKQQPSAETETTPTVDTINITAVSVQELPPTVPNIDAITIPIQAPTANVTETAPMENLSTTTAAVEEKPVTVENIETVVEAANSTANQLAESDNNAQETTAAAMMDADQALIVDEQADLVAPVDDNVERLDKLLQRLERAPSTRRQSTTPTLYTPDIIINNNNSSALHLTPRPEVSLKEVRAARTASLGRGGTSRDEHILSALINFLRSTGPDMLNRSANSSDSSLANVSASSLVDGGGTRKQQQQQPKQATTLSRSPVPDNGMNSDRQRHFMAQLRQASSRSIVSNSSASNNNVVAATKRNKAIRTSVIKSVPTDGNTTSDDETSGNQSLEEFLDHKLTSRRETLAMAEFLRQTSPDDLKLMLATLRAKTGKSGGNSSLNPKPKSASTPSFTKDADAGAAVDSQQQLLTGSAQTTGKVAASKSMSSMDNRQQQRQDTTTSSSTSTTDAVPSQQQSLKEMLRDGPDEHNQHQQQQSQQPPQHKRRGFPKFSGFGKASQKQSQQQAQHLKREDRVDKRPESFLAESFHSLLLGKKSGEDTSEPALAQPANSMNSVAALSGSEEGIGATAADRTDVTVSHTPSVSAIETVAVETVAVETVAVETEAVETVAVETVAVETVTVTVAEHSAGQTENGPSEPAEVPAISQVDATVDEQPPVDPGTSATEDSTLPGLIVHLPPPPQKPPVKAQRPPAGKKLTPASAASKLHDFVSVNADDDADDDDDFMGGQRKQRQTESLADFLRTSEPTLLQQRPNPKTVDTQTPTRTVKKLVPAPATAKYATANNGDNDDDDDDDDGARLFGHKPKRKVESLEQFLRNSAPPDEVTVTVQSLRVSQKLQAVARVAKRAQPKQKQQQPDKSAKSAPVTLNAVDAGKQVDGTVAQLLAKIATLTDVNARLTSQLASTQQQQLSLDVQPLPEADSKIYLRRAQSVPQLSNNNSSGGSALVQALRADNRALRRRNWQLHTKTDAQQAVMQTLQQQLSDCRRKLDDLCVRACGQLEGLVQDREQLEQDLAVAQTLAMNNSTSNNVLKTTASSLSSQPGSTKTTAAIQVARFGSELLPVSSSAKELPMAVTTMMATQ